VTDHVAIETLAVTLYESAERSSAANIGSHPNPPWLSLQAGTRQLYRHAAALMVLENAMQVSSQPYPSRVPA